ncbi:MAG: hypothetical protein ACLT4Y_11495 [Bifidobacterium breve]
MNKIYCRTGCTIAALGDDIDGACGAKIQGDSSGTPDQNMAVE